MGEKEPARGAEMIEWGNPHTAAVAQLVVAPDCGSGCRGFKSHQPPQGSTSAAHSLFDVLTLIDYDHAALHHDLGFQPIPITLQRVAIQKNHVGQLACFQCADLIAHLDV